ncbi:MAG TPA: MarR family winged helix-turn-helix transcriptional regulator [Methylomirabilota bacterium]|nr:MarR family winged helix-turn-helix transcriptional regulator [Methylomirabilota bacterium]
MAGSGLTIGQFGVLEALLHHGPLCQRELGAKLLRSDGNTAVVVGNLVRRGLVTQTRRRDDRRFVMVTLTARGSALIGEIFPRHVTGLVREMSRLLPGELQTLGSLCRRLGRRHDEPAAMKGDDTWRSTRRASGRSSTTRRAASRSSTMTHATTSSRTSSRSRRSPVPTRRSPSARTSSM